ncbi:actin-related protein 4 [Macadamia integrifolia]|uniref:actin-related protein 4 n=1 Tax=Macadamia integrifolia TaxID=60698 RepID=UPI001C4E9566|nr:actin-related protein 4 [Macadamia integrifolia]
MYGGDEVSAVVIDLGSHTCKAGYAGEDAPKAVFPSVVGSIDQMDVDDAVKSDSGSAPDSKSVVRTFDSDKSKTKRKFYVGSQALGYRRDHMEVLSPIKDGVVVDWDIVDSIWDHAFRERLLIDPKEHPMLLAEPSSNTQQQRERTAELMFERYKVPALFLAKNAVLTSFASGRATSLVVDSGGGSTTVAPVHDGYVLQKALLTSPIGGEFLTECMMKSLESKGIMMKPRYSFKRKEIRPGEFQTVDLDFPNTTESYKLYCQRAIASDIKECVCRAPDTPYDESAYANVPTTPYELPDGQWISIVGGIEKETISTPLAEEEKIQAAALTTLQAQEESFLRQKSRITWLKLGDSNSAYFHKSVKARNNVNSITKLSTPEGNLVHRVDEIKKVAVDYFEDLFRPPTTPAPPISGCPLSPYKFCLAMEVLSRSLQVASDWNLISAIPKCKAMKLTHLAFADDLMIFSKADPTSMQNIMLCLSQFADMSGLRINPAKSLIFLAGISDFAKASILDHMGFCLGHLPVKYMGLPLIPTRLFAHQCTPMLDLIRKRLQLWKGRLLSFAGRFVLIRSVLQASYIYWSGTFGLPESIISKLESIFASFLWKGSECVRFLCPSSWVAVCLPKEGGLGIRRIKDVNSAGIIKLAWKIISKKDIYQQTIPGMESFSDSAVPVRGLPQMVVESINKCDVDIRRELFSSILLAGGTASMQQLKERLEKDLLEESPQTARVKVLAIGNSTERRFSVWIGGSILASLGSFQQMWFSKAEYEEHGASYVQRKCP